MNIHIGSMVHIKKPTSTHYAQIHTTMY